MQVICTAVKYPRPVDVKQLVERFNRAVNDADIAALEALFDPDIRYRSSGDVSELVGAEEVCAFYEAAFDGRMRVRLAHIFADGEDVAAELELTETRYDGEVTVRDTAMRQVWRNGLLVEHRHYSDVRRLQADVTD